MTDIQMINIHLMYGPEGNSYFWFPSSLDVSLEFVSGNKRKTKLTSSPRDHTLSVLLYINLDFPLNNHTAKTNKQRQRAGNNCAIVSWSGYI